jgi:hypothetical protein
MIARLSRIWRAVWNARRRWWEILTVRRDRVAAAISTKPEAELMAASPRPQACVQDLIAILRAHYTELNESERAKYEAARALIGELA